MRFCALVLLFSGLSTLGALAQLQCGSEVGGALCSGGYCCSQWGYCGSDSAFCCDGCQSQCDTSICPTPTPPTPPPPPPPPITPTPPTPPSPPGEDISSLISRSLFDQMFMHQTYPSCDSQGFYTYDAFIAAANSFEGFGTAGDIDTRKREIAAFLAQTSHETTGGSGWADAPDGPYAWGYCFVKEQGNPGDYCVQSQEWPCAPGKKYYGRGPIQISYNYNYGQAGDALQYDLLNNPDAVETDPIMSFKTAFWFWMTPQPPKPSCHDVMVGKWIPTPADVVAGRVPGYGVTTNIINGGLECGIPSPDQRVEDRIGFYKNYTVRLGVSYGENLDCYNQRPFG